MRTLGSDLIHYLRRLRAWVRPDIRAALDGVGLYLTITLLFCLIATAHDGIVNRQTLFDQQRWWYPIYRAIYLQ